MVYSIMSISRALTQLRESIDELKVLFVLLMLAFFILSYLIIVKLRRIYKLRANGLTIKHAVAFHPVRSL